jgi:methyltransferase
MVMYFYLLFIFLILQRFTELTIAKSNERWMKARGAFETGQSHYKWIVLVHTGFFLSFFIEVVFVDREPAVWWWIPFVVFLAAQVLRVWSLASLGHFWNTRIIILPGADVVAKGPYRLMRHPNYVIVAAEILSIPLIFQAYVTAVLFSILNVIILSIRIPIEEKALADATDYKKTFRNRRRFIP